MVKSVLLLGLAAGMLSACATVEEAINPTPEVSERADRLTPRDLKSGECGLFVFTIDADPRLILFSDNIGNRAAWTEGAGEVQLISIERTGAPSLGQYPVQTFALPDGRRLEMELVNGEDIDSGTRYSSGTLKTNTPEGWDKVIPVTALAGCQTAAS